jgi:hypothetical protein
VRLTNTAEGGTNGTTVTAANSGGASFDAWSSNPTIGSGAALIFDSTQAMHGNLSYRFSTGGSSVQCKVAWTFTAVGTIQFRIYVRTPGAFTNLPTILRMQGSGTQTMRIAWNSSGNLIVRDTGNFQQGQSSTTFTSGTWYRIEGYCTAGSSSVAEVKIWTTPDDTGAANETLSLSAKNFGTASIDTVEIGQVAAATNIPQWWADDITITDTAAYIGPVATAQANAAITASGSVAGPGVEVGQSAAALAAVGVVTTAGTAVGLAAAALTAAATLTSAGQQVQPAAAALTAADTLTVAATPVRPAAAALAAAATLTPTAAQVQPAAGSLSAATALDTAAVPVRPAAAALAAAGQLAASAAGAVQAAADLTTTVTLAADATITGTTQAEAALTTDATLSASAVRVVPGSGTLASGLDLAAASVAVLQTLATIEATVALAASATVIPGTAASAGRGTPRLATGSRAQLAPASTATLTTRRKVVLR